MTQSDTCTVGGCEKNAAPRLKVCWAHYQRGRRGAKVTGEVRNYGTGQELINGPMIAPKVTALLKTLAKTHPAPSGEPSLYEAQRQILKGWLARAAAGQPWLSGTKAFTDPVLRDDGDEGYKSHGKVPLLKEEALALKAHMDSLSKNQGKPLSLYGLLVLIFDDWYWFWVDRKGPGKPEEVCPWPLAKKVKAKR
jgi:hypothetical protein